MASYKIVRKITMNQQKENACKELDGIIQYRLSKFYKKK